MGKIIRIAAANSSPEDKQKADVVCLGIHDEEEINRQLELLVNGGTLQLLDGDYNIDAFPCEGNSAICFGYNEGRARVINVIGDTENKGYNTQFGVTIHVTEQAMRSLPEGETGRVFYGTGKRPEAPGDFFTMTYVNNVNFQNFYVMLFNASYPVIGVDSSHFGSSDVFQVGVFTEHYFQDRFLHLKPATPAVGCIGFRSCNDSNDEMSRIGYRHAEAGGVHTGFDFIGADHVIMECCFAARCCYGFVFHHSYKTLTLLNCSDEGNTHLPQFYGSGCLSAIDFNIERFNAAYIPDDPCGNSEPHATEECVNSWHGFISYTLQGNAFGLRRFWKDGHGHNFRTVNLKHSRICRPEDPEFLESYFDGATGKTMTWNGSAWLDPMGNVSE